MATRRGASPARRRRCSSSHSSASRSRWLVGSSSSSRSGSAITRPRERGARLLAARQRGRRLRPLVAARSRGRTAPHRRAGRACTRRARRTGAGGRRSRVSVDAAGALELGQLGSPSSRDARHPSRTAVRRSGAAMNAASRCASCASSPSAGRACATTVPRRARRVPATIRSSVVLPAPFGPTRPTRSPRAMARVDPIEDDERADLAGHARRAAGSTTSRLPPPAPPRGGWRPPTSCAAVRARGAGRPAACGRRPVVELGPAPAAA